MRALGALAVATFHVFAVVKGAGGVPLLSTAGLGHLLFAFGTFSLSIFFALSGYMLFWPFVRQYFAGGDPVDLRRFALNRIARVMPLYYFMIVLLLLVQEDNATLGQWWRFLTLSENFFVYTAGTLNAPMWAVVVELHFYVLLPVIAYGLARVSGGSLGRAAAALLAVGALSIALRLATVLLPDGPNTLWRFSLPTTFFFCVSGMLVALLRLHWERNGRPAWIRGAIARADVWLVAALPFGLIMAFDEALDPVTAIGAFLIVGGIGLPLSSGPLLKALDWKPIAIIGLASYSIFLWHAPVTRALVNIDGVPLEFLGLTAVAIPCTIVVALISYRVIESPFLRLRRQWARSSAQQETTPSRATG